MGRRLTLVVTSVLLLLRVAPVTGQVFTGTYSTPADAGGTATLTLQEEPDGSVFGTFESAGLVWNIDAVAQGDGATGVMTSSGSTLFFEARATGPTMLVTLTGTDRRGRPDPSDVREIEFYGAERANAGVGQRPLAGNPLSGRGQPGPGGNPLARAGTDPYVGTFSDGLVVLHLERAASQYQGQVTVDGQAYPVSVASGPGGLQGVIHGSQASYPLSIQALSGALLVTSGGQQIYLYPTRTFAPPSAGLSPGYGDPSRAYVPGIRPPGFGYPDVWGPYAFERSSTGRPLAPGYTEDDPLVEEWSAYLAGARIGRIQGFDSRGAGGYGGRAELTLCSDYSFGFREEGRGGAADRGFGLTPDAGLRGGQWLVIANGRVAILILEFDDGALLEYRLARRGETIYANGGRVVLSPSDSCR